MTPAQIDLIRQHASPLAPVPTGVAASLHALSTVRAVLFDIYGTLLISASGEVGAAGPQDGCASGASPRDSATPGTAAPGAAMEQALQAVGLDFVAEPSADRQACLRGAGECLATAIRQSHEASRAAGITDPEVDIVAVWQQTLAVLEQRGWIAPGDKPVDARQLALEYELRTNPTWPMPGAASCLLELARRGLLTGLVSNAQFFTPALFPALFGRTAEQLGVDAQLQFYSYQHGWAKPGPALFHLASSALARRSVPPCDVLYIGNDLLNDVWGASQAGFRTALFAGDARSLRLRRGDARVADVQPDLIVTDLSQLVACVAGTGSEP